MSGKGNDDQSSVTSANESTPGSSKQRSTAEESDDYEEEESTDHSELTEMLIERLQRSANVTARRPARGTGSISTTGSTFTPTTSDASEVQYAFLNGHSAYHKAFKTNVTLRQDVLKSEPLDTIVDILHNDSQCRTKLAYLETALLARVDGRLLRSAVAKTPRANYKEISDCESKQSFESAASGDDETFQSLPVHRAPTTIIDLTTPESGQIPPAAAAASLEPASFDDKYPSSTSSQESLQPLATAGIDSSFSGAGDLQRKRPPKPMFCIVTQPDKDNDGNINRPSPFSTVSSLSSPTFGALKASPPTTPLSSPDNGDGRSDSATQIVMDNALVLRMKNERLQAEVDCMKAELARAQVDRDRKDAEMMHRMMELEAQVACAHVDLDKKDAEIHLLRRQAEEVTLQFHQQSEKMMQIMHRAAEEREHFLAELIRERQKEQLRFKAQRLATLVNLLESYHAGEDVGVQPDDAILKASGNDDDDDDDDNYDEELMIGLQCEAKAEEEDFGGKVSDDMV